mmetsp:Transcript_19489/g.20893  ORF Transcript_19489/g.20893 Transcript_19489/m.20893 type:complete len:242 (+) Transcript_19489:227-952(+)
MMYIAMYLTDARIWCIILILYFVLRCAIKLNANRREQQENDDGNENTAHIDNNSNNNNELAIGSDNDNNNNAEEIRINVINDRLVFRELSLSTESTQQEGKSNERDLKMTRTKDTDVEDRDQDVLNTTTNGNNYNNTDVGDSVRSFFSSLGFFRQDGVIPKDDDCCSICLEEYKIGDTIARSNTGNNRDKTEEDDNNSNSCNHCFHKDCIVAWLQIHDECPLCRVDMIKIPETRSISNGSS